MTDKRRMRMPAAFIGPAPQECAGRHDFRAWLEQFEAST
jgi:hypothetical protein